MDLRVLADLASIIASSSVTDHAHLLRGKVQANIKQVPGARKDPQHAGRGDLPGRAAHTCSQASVVRFFGR